MKHMKDVVSGGPLCNADSLGAGVTDSRDLVSCDDCLDILDEEDFDDDDFDDDFPDDDEDLDDE